MKAELDELVGLSRALGANPAYAQGGGGNTSIKLDGRRMWIKASGVELGEVTAARGFVLVDYAAIKAGLTAAKTEADYIYLLADAVINRTETSPRPSIESGFHAVLGRVVAHSHSVWLNILACAKEGREALATILPDAAWLEYVTPGLPVTQKIRETFAGRQTPNIILLQNHGLIISADSVADALAVHEQANEKMRAHFKLDAAYPLPRVPQVQADAAHLLFPDQAVYICSAEMAGSKGAADTLKAYDFLVEKMQVCGLTPHYLPAEEAAFLLNMETEKYRQKVAKQNA